jgi:hypothetical protein
MNKQHLVAEQVPVSPSLFLVKVNVTGGSLG